MHLHHHHQNHHKLLVFSTTTPTPTPCFHIMDCEAPDDGLTASRPLPFEEATHKNMTLLTSFSGLVCVGITSCGEYSHLILWNPLTDDYTKLSKPHDNSLKDCYNQSGKAFGLYYSSSDNDFRLLRVTQDYDAYIYSLRFDTWRKIHNDSREELKTDINSFFGNVEVTCLSHRGCIHLYVIDAVNFTGWGLELWRMDGDGDWKKVQGIVSDNVFMVNIHPLHLMKDGNCLTHSGSEDLVYKIDLGCHMENISCLFKAHGLDIPPPGKYIESLVSPNRYRLVEDHEEEVEQNGLDSLGVQASASKMRERRRNRWGKKRRAYGFDGFRYYSHLT
ncbi:unnamed protein product [Lactuca virosa]|uniref:F-box associated domain-containing protein n=1 Tax=Lactuca virosa TaxID=75947 RepID=A0AAU9PNI6_9ASTR|nr:unnamed protein product [Lactuca virosa]